MSSSWGDDEGRAGEARTPGETHGQSKDASDCFHSVNSDKHYTKELIYITLTLAKRSEGKVNISDPNTEKPFKIVFHP